jgi:hypothetical protein
VTEYFKADPDMPGTALRHEEEKKRILREERKLERQQARRKPTRKDPRTGFDLVESASPVSPKSKIKDADGDELVDVTQLPATSGDIQDIIAAYPRRLYNKPVWRKKKEVQG